VIGFYAERLTTYVRENTDTAILDTDYFAAAGRRVNAAVGADGRVLRALVVTQIDAGG
jgi:hypothetical protein